MSEAEKEREKRSFLQLIEDILSDSNRLTSIEELDNLLQIGREYNLDYSEKMKSFSSYRNEFKSFVNQVDNFLKHSSSLGNNIQSLSNEVKYSMHETVLLLVDNPMSLRYSQDNQNPIQLLLTEYRKRLESSMSSPSVANNVHSNASSSIEPLIVKWNSEVSQLASVSVPLAVSDELLNIRRTHEDLIASFATSNKFQKLNCLLALASIINKFVANLFQLSDNSLIKKGIHSLFNQFIELCKQVKSANDSFGLAWIFIGIIRQLPTSRQQQLLWRLKAAIISSHPWNQSLFPIESSLKVSSQEFQFFCASLAVDESESNPFNQHESWTWLVRSCRLYQSIVDSSERTNDRIILIDHLLTALLIFVRMTGGFMYEKYGKNFIDLLKQLETSLKSNDNLNKNKTQTNLLMIVNDIITCSSNPSLKLSHWLNKWNFESSFNIQLLSNIFS